MDTPFPFSEVGLDFVQTIVTLDAGHIAGTTAIVAANSNRCAIKFGGASRTILISLDPSVDTGMSYAASYRDGDSGSDCPRGALFLATGQDLTVGSTIVVWEA